MTQYSVYLHFPFCQHRCSYCDFNTYAGIDDLIPDYVNGLCREIELLVIGAGASLPVKTIFFGGGTPSLLPVPELDRILSTLAKSFDLQPGLEITLEANPGTLSLAYLKELHQLGINRLSLGMQSANPDELALLERQHGMDDVEQAVSWARAAGFNNLNLDLMFGVPHQTIQVWQDNLEAALLLQPDHFSLYALTLEHGTPMHHWVGRGLLQEPDPDLAAEMYEWASQRLEQAGFVQYEISNWAYQQEDGKIFSCAHNLQYWRNLPYLGFGAGAHGFAGGFRTANVLSPAAYNRRCLEGKAQTFPCTPATADFVEIDRNAEIAETMMMGLRLTKEGVSGKSFCERFGETLVDMFGERIDRLCASGLLERVGSKGDILRLTSRGRILGNQVFIEFI